MRQSLGTAVFSGMISVTLFGIILTPVFFFILLWSGEQRPGRRTPAPHLVAATQGTGDGRTRGGSTNR
jgi:hypothetical protein